MTSRTYSAAVLASLASLAVVLALTSVAWACTPSGWGTPSATLDPASGPGGTSVRVSASGYQPAVAVPIDLLSEAGGRTRLGTGTPDATGRLSVGVTIPDVPAGSYSMTVGTAGKAAFEVTQPPPVIPPIVTEPAAPPLQPPAPQGGPVSGLTPSTTTTSGLTPSTTAAVGSDATGPRVSAQSLPGQRLATVFRRGLLFSVGCSKACRIEARAAIGAGRAQSLRLTGTVARSSGSLSRTGRTRLVMKLSLGARTKLRRARAVTLRVTFTGTDRAGNATVLNKTVNLRR